MKILPVVITWKSLKDYTYIFLGTLLQALALRLFLVPAQLVIGGISGIAQIVNHFSGWPIGLMTLVGNIPLFLLGWRYLGGSRFAMRTAFSVICYSFFVDVLVFFLPANGLTSDILLDTLYGAVLCGIGYGLVYRGKGTSGGSDILARILNHRYGTSLSQSYLMVDTLVILAAGLTFNWEKALYALVMLYVSGIAAETATEGSGIARTVMVITSQPEKIAETILVQMERGVTQIPVRGAYTGSQGTMLYCVVSRSEVSQIETLITEIDKSAFIVIGHAHEAIGEGFREIEGQ